MSQEKALAPLVLIVSGPSGSGKSTLVQRLLQMPGTMASRSCTTRPRRTTEASGKCYDFVTDEEFEAMVSRGEFLEYARVFGKHSYGTPKKWLEESVAIFILPPSQEELEHRLRSRGQDADEEIARRLARARAEIEAFGRYYDYCVMNADVEQAGREVESILTAVRCGRTRQRARVEELLASFGGKD